MKLIHTADLHLGNRMHKVDRDIEHDNFLKWLKETIISEKADTLIIAGDVYDVKNPSNESRKKFNNFLVSLLGSDCKNVIIIGGNHDSGSHLDADKELMEALNFHMVGSLQNCSIGDAVFKLFDKEGNVIGICAAIPFLQDIELKTYCDMETLPKEYGNIAVKTIYDKALEEAKRMRGDLDVPIIATGHLYTANIEGRYADPEYQLNHDDGVKNYDVVGNLGHISADSFSKEYDYVALGHIHYTSMVAGKKNIRYSGSPFVMGFDEANRAHHVLSVECLPNSKITVNPIAVPISCHFTREEGNSDELKEKILKLENKYDDTLKIYVEASYEKRDSSAVNQMLDSLEYPDRVEVVSRKLKISSNNVDVNFENRTIHEMQNLDPKEIFTNRIKMMLEMNGDSEEEQQTIDMYLEYFLKAYEMVQIMGR